MGRVRLPSVGTEFTVQVCADCGFIEGGKAQAGCCPSCGSRSGDLARALCRIERYVPGDYWPRESATTEEEHGLVG